MAGKKISGYIKVRASTIPEVVVSMVIIIVVFGIAMMIYTNVMRMPLSLKRVRAEAILQEMMLSIREGGIATNQTVTLDDFRIEQEIKPVPDASQLNEVTLTAYDQNDVQTCRVREIIISSANEK